MKRSLLLILILTMLGAGSLRAQISQIQIDHGGDFRAEIEIGHGRYVTINSFGELLGTNSSRTDIRLVGHGPHARVSAAGVVGIDYYSQRDGRPRVRYIGRVPIRYYDNDEGRSGAKVKRIGDIKI